MLTVAAIRTCFNAPVYGVRASLTDSSYLSDGNRKCLIRLSCAVLKLRETVTYSVQMPAKTCRQRLRLCPHQNISCFMVHMRFTDCLAW